MTPDFTTPMGAIVSPCGTYRTHLWRRWGDGPTALWCMLNPSTADHVMNDPTIGRITSFSRGWGYGGLHVVNLFAYRATDSMEILGTHDIDVLCGPDFWQSITEAVVATSAVRLICGWGTKGRHLGQDQRMLSAARALGLWTSCLGTNNDATPVHPLYQPVHTKLRGLR